MRACTRRERWSYENRGPRFSGGPSSSWQYDGAGRLTSQAAPYPIFSPSPNPVSVTRTYDAEDHINAATRESGSQGSWPSGSVSWGPDGHPIVIGVSKNGGSPNNERLHWNGDQLLFTTNNQSGQAVADDIKLGADGDILPGDPGYNGLTFFDRGPGGTILGCHNLTGDSYAGFTNGFLGFTVTPCVSNPSQSIKMPSSLVWQGNPYTGPLTVGTGGTLGMGRIDGFTDGFDAIQGVRAYDNNSGSWTTPDAFTGTVEDPSSQKSYLWNGNNPMSYMDPSGYFTTQNGWAWPNWGEDPEFAMWAIYLDLLSNNGLLTIGHVIGHCSGCRRYTTPIAPDNNTGVPGPGCINIVGTPMLPPGASWSAENAAGRAHGFDLVAFYNLTVPNNAPFNYQRQSFKKYWAAGNFGLGVYASGAGIAESLVDQAITAVGNAPHHNLSPQQIAEDQALAQAGRDWADQNCH